jgi:hypothetical protein
MKRTDWRTPLTIPEGTVGEYHIQHMLVPAGHPVMMNNGRNAMMGGQKAPKTITFDEDTRWHKLTGPTGTWMTDLPVEQRQHDTELKGLKGHVLIGGLGLGYAAHVLSQRKSVSHVTVVEISPEVINLVRLHVKQHWHPKGKHRGWKVEIVQADLLDYLKNYQGTPFTDAFYDIWQSDSESTFFGTVVPLLRLSEDKVKGRPVCWNENVMRGQLRWSIQSREMTQRLIDSGIAPDAYKNMRPLWENDGTDSPWHNWSVPYFQWKKEAQPTDEQAEYMASLYVSQYGTRHFETKWKVACAIGMKGEMVR